MSSDKRATTLLDHSGEARLETVQTEALPEDVRSMVQMHLDIAARRAREGSPLQGFQELVRASRAMPMNARLAAALVRLAKLAGTEQVALLLISEGVDDSDGLERLGVQRQLARLTRRLDELDRAQETLSIILAERPEDRRARAVLNALLARRERWEELDASLDKATREALRRGQLRAASRVALQRARLWAETLDDPARAALRAMQAAQFAEQAKDLPAAFLLRLLWLRNLARAKAPQRSLDEAARVVLALGARVGQAESAHALVEELGLHEPISVETKELSEPGLGSGETTPSAATPRRRSTQLELVAVAEVAESAGRKREAAAIFAAAVREGPDPQAALKLEAHFIQRGAWRELAHFYRDLLNRSAAGDERAKWGEKLAELLESELHDPQSAAQAWAEVAAATGDSHAVSEQVRLLTLKKDQSGIREALDAGVRQASAAIERARALVLRAEEALTRRQVAAARADFEAALEAVPDHPDAAAGLAELAAMQGDHAPIRALQSSLQTIARKTPGRGDLYRRLARLADSPLRDHRLARSAWQEVVAELPGDEEATGRLLTLLRASGDDALLEQLIIGALQKEPRGPRARELRMEQVRLMERQHRDADALDALKKAVRAEPGHREAWLAYAERLTVLGTRDPEVAWALEHAATATDDVGLRLQLWQRLGRFVRERLNDPGKAETYERRAEKLQRELMQNAPPPPSPPRPAQPSPPALPGGPLVVPPRRQVRAKVAISDSIATPQAAPPVHESFDELPRNPFGDEGDAQEPTSEFVPEQAREEEEEVTPAPAPPPVYDEVEAEEIRSSELVPLDELDRARGPIPVAAPAPRETAEVELGDPGVLVPPSFGPSPAKALSAERQALFEHVRAHPLEADGYKLLAEHFDTANDAARSSLMLEIARALEGDPHAAPRTPRLILTATDRAGLKHPALRGEGGELLSLVGTVLCRLNPARGREAGTDVEFTLDAGRGARPVAEALFAAVRVLGMRSPDVYLSEEPGPPLSVIYASEPRILVGRAAVKKEVSDAELRFFAGRTLFTQQPELLALRTLRREQVMRGLVLVHQVTDGRGSPVDTKLVREAVPARAWDRLKHLVRTVGTKVDLAQLTEGARHSANRAGLVVCGGIAPAVASLRAKKALPSEMTELIRFAASERYLQLRNRNLPVPGRRS